VAAAQAEVGAKTNEVRREALGRIPDSAGRTPKARTRGDEPGGGPAVQFRLVALHDHHGLGSCVWQRICVVTQNVVRCRYETTRRPLTFRRQ